MYHLFSKKLYPGLNFSTQFCKNVFSLEDAHEHEIKNLKEKDQNIKNKLRP